MRFSEARHHEVVSTTTATKVARLEGFVVAARPGRITALRLGKVDGDGNLLSWGDVTAFGRDAITIQDPATIHAAGDDAERAESAPDHDMLGKPLLSERGDGLGKVVDVDFDVRTGEVIALITDRDEIAGRLLLGVGSYAVVVAIDEPPDPGA